jgi:hypothetical protein
MLFINDSLVLSKRYLILDSFNLISFLSQYNLLLIRKRIY